MSVLSDYVKGHSSEPDSGEKRVANLMVPLENYCAVSIRTTLRDAVFVLQRLFKNREGEASLPYLLVFKNKTAVGILRIYDLLELVQPPVLNEGWYRGWHLPGSWSEPVFFSGIFTRQCLEIADKPVSDAMQPFTLYLHPNDTLSRAIYLMVKHGLDVVPVRDGNQIVGLLRTQEIFDELSTIMGLRKC